MPNEEQNKTTSGSIKKTEAHNPIQIKVFTVTDESSINAFLDRRDIILVKDGIRITHSGRFIITWVKKIDEIDETATTPKENILKSLEEMLEKTVGSLIQAKLEYHVAKDIEKRKHGNTQAQVDAASKVANAERKVEAAEFEQRAIEKTIEDVKLNIVDVSKL